MLYVTPSFPPDYERLALLLTSVRRFNPDARHVIIVADEDAQSGRVAFGSDTEIVTHSEVLPGASRQLHRLPGPVKRRIKLGWWLQQLAKLNVGRSLGFPSWVCLDSDTFLIDEIRYTDCYDTDGRPRLLELLDHPVGPHVERYNARAAALLDLPTEAGTVERVYTGMCVPMSGIVCEQLLSWIEDRYRGPWWLTMCRRQGTEYALYGQFARYRNRLRDVVPVHEPLSVDIYERLPPEAAVDRIRRGRAHGRRLAMFHSHLGYESAALQEIAAEVWGG